MINIYTLNHPNAERNGTKMNMEELYEKRRKRDEKQAMIYRKVLSRAHDHIRRVAKKGGLPCTWFSIPPVVMGVPNYDQAGCIAYLLDQLQENKFVVRFYYPNHLFITWNHFVPKYVRDEIHQKTGVEVDEYGNPVPQEEEEEDVDPRQSDAYHRLAQSALAINNKNKRSATSASSSDGNPTMSGGGSGGAGRGRARNGNGNAFTPIDAYRPSGKMVYREDTLNRLQNRLPSSSDMLTGNTQPAQRKTRSTNNDTTAEPEYSFPIYDPNIY